MCLHLTIVIPPSPLWTGSSSGVVNAVLDFTAFDEQITRSAGPECAAVLRNVTFLAEDRISTPAGKVAMYASFAVDATDFADEGDFWYLLADGMSLPFQYGYPDKICDPMLAAQKRGDDLVDAFASFCKSFFYPVCPHPPLHDLGGIVGCVLFSVRPLMLS